MRSDLDAKIEIWAEGASSPLVTFNPEGQLMGSNDFEVPSEGQYFLAVTGVGEGADATAGYTAYGETTLVGSLCGKGATAGKIPACMRVGAGRGGQP